MQWRKYFSSSSSPLFYLQITHTHAHTTQSLSRKTQQQQKKMWKTNTTIQMMKTATVRNNNKKNQQSSWCVCVRACVCLCVWAQLRAAAHCTLTGCSGWLVHLDESSPSMNYPSPRSRISTSFRRTCRSRSLQKQKRRHCGFFFFLTWCPIFSFFIYISLYI